MITNIEGVNNPVAKLTEIQVKEIAELIKGGNYKYTEIAKMYNVSDSTICSIANNNSWKHLNLDIKQDDLSISKLFTNDEIYKICKFFESCDINNLYLYPSINKLLEECLYDTSLINKYELEKVRKTLVKILRKQGNYTNFAQKFNYQFTR